jgi:hypothetical protein
MCCSQKRTAFLNSSATPAMRTVMPANPGPPPQIMNGPAAVASPYAPVSVRYVETAPIRVRGPVTGQHYDFSGSRPVLAVDARDAASLLQSRFFRRA